MYVNLENIFYCSTLVHNLHLRTIIKQHWSFCMKYFYLLVIAVFMVACGEQSNDIAEDQSLIMNEINEDAVNEMNTESSDADAANDM